VLLLLDPSPMESQQPCTFCASPFCTKQTYYGCIRVCPLDPSWNWVLVTYRGRSTDMVWNGQTTSGISRLLRCVNYCLLDGEYSTLMCDIRAGETQDVQRVEPPTKKTKTDELASLLSSFSISSSDEDGSGKRRRTG